MAAIQSTVGCIGAGVLGAAIMQRLIERGFRTIVWNRDRAKLDPIVAAGGILAGTPEALARESDFVITCITDGAAVEKVVFGEHGVAAAGSADKILIDMSTCAAVKTREMAQRLLETCGMPWLDAPISGGAPAALEGRMAVMIGGDPDAFERARPVWDALAGRATLMGPSGAGQSTKMINQVLVSTGLAVLAEACGLAEKAGIDAARIPHALSGGRADSKQLQEMFPKMVASEFSITGRAAIMMKDLELIHDLAKSVGAPMPVTAIVTEIFRKMVADGLGDRDNAELVNYYRPASSRS